MTGNGGIKVNGTCMHESKCFSSFVNNEIVKNYKTQENKLKK